MTTMAMTTSLLFSHSTIIIIYEKRQNERTSECSEYSELSELNGPTLPNRKKGPVTNQTALLIGTTGRWRYAAQLPVTGGTRVSCRSEHESLLTQRSAS